MRRASLTAIAVFAVRCLAQSPLDVQFAVAPSKAKQPTNTSVMPAYTGNQIVFTGATLKGLAAYAFGWNESNIAGGPAWTNTSRWDVVARAPGTLAAARFPQILREALETRFGLKTHRETRNVPVYDLVIAGPRHRMTASTSSQSYSSLARGRVKAKRWTMTQFASLLQRVPETGRPVRDKTGLTGEFDIDLNYAAGLSSAIEKQLGLKLIPSTGPVEFLVIDAAGQP